MDTVTGSEHIVANVLVLVLLVAVDMSIVKPIAKRMCAKARDVPATRWFVIHACANFVVVILSFRSVLATFADPLHSLDVTVHNDRTLWGTASRWPLTIINSVHVYHMIGGFRLSGGDYFHHALFIPTLGFPGQYYNWGALGNQLGFFISGLPGGIDYALLGLVKLGLMDRLREKRYSANLNTWCRCPGIVGTTVLYSQAVLYGLYDTNIPTLCVSLYIVLPLYNGLYYGRQAVANYTVNFIKEHILEVYTKPKYWTKRRDSGDMSNPLKLHTRISKSTGLEVIDWKRIISDLGEEPQRGS